MWYGVTSKFKWVDSHGKGYIIEQGDGGEQGDALMPALFCLALRPALQHIHARLPPGAEIIAYLDDIYVVCNPDEVEYVLALAESTLQTTCSIDVNMGKLAIWGALRHNHAQTR